MFLKAKWTKTIVNDISFVKKKKQAFVRCKNWINKKDKQRRGCIILNKRWKRITSTAVMWNLQNVDEESCSHVTGERGQKELMCYCYLPLTELSCHSDPPSLPWLLLSSPGGSSSVLLCGDVAPEAELSSGMSMWSSSLSRSSSVLMMDISGPLLTKAATYQCHQGNIRKIWKNVINLHVCRPQ